MLFDGLTAWFSSSVSRKWIDIWQQNGGKVNSYDSASLLFSEDNAATDTKRLFGQRYSFEEEKAILHPAYIGACVSLDSLDNVAVANYQLMSRELIEAFREKRVVSKNKMKCNCQTGKNSKKRKREVCFLEESESLDVQESACVSEFGSCDGLDWGLFLRCVGYVESSMLGKVTGELEIVRISDKDSDYEALALSTEEASSTTSALSSPKRKQRPHCKKCNYSL